jgi:GGDEF domain-containing protein
MPTRPANPYDTLFDGAPLDAGGEPNPFDDMFGLGAPPAAAPAPEEPGAVARAWDAGRSALHTVADPFLDIVSIPKKGVDAAVALGHDVLDPYNRMGLKEGNEGGQVLDRVMDLNPLTAPVNYVRRKGAEIGADILEGNGHPDAARYLRAAEAADRALQSKVAELGSDPAMFLLPESKLIGGAFLPGAVEGAVEGAREAKRQYDAHGVSPESAVPAVGAVADAAMAAMIGAHLLHGEPRPAPLTGEVLPPMPMPPERGLPPAGGAGGPVIDVEARVVPPDGQRLLEPSYPWNAEEVPPGAPPPGAPGAPMADPRLLPTGPDLGMSAEDPALLQARRLIGDGAPRPEPPRPVEAKPAWQLEREAAAAAERAANERAEQAERDAGDRELPAEEVGPLHDQDAALIANVKPGEQIRSAILTPEAREEARRLAATLRDGDTITDPQTGLTYTVQGGLLVADGGADIQTLRKTTRTDKRGVLAPGNDALNTVARGKIQRANPTAQKGTAWRPSPDLRIVPPEEIEQRRRTREAQDRLAALFDDEGDPRLQERSPLLDMTPEQREAALRRLNGEQALLPAPAPPRARGRGPQGGEGPSLGPIPLDPPRPTQGIPYDGGPDAQLDTTEIQRALRVLDQRNAPRTGIPDRPGEPTMDVDAMNRALQAPRPEAPRARTDRRALERPQDDPVARRQRLLSEHPEAAPATIERLAQLEEAHASAERRAQEAEQNHLSGLAGRNAFERAKATHKGPWASMDMGGLGFVNDFAGGHQVGDAFLRGIGATVRDVLADHPGVEAFHYGGDEVALKGDTPEALQRAAEAIQHRVMDVEITGQRGGKDVAFKGARFDFGVGDDFASADRALDRSKREALESGLRRRPEDKGRDVAPPTFKFRDVGEEQPAAGVPAPQPPPDAGAEGLRGEPGPGHDPRDLAAPEAPAEVAPPRVLAPSRSDTVPVTCPRKTGQHRKRQGTSSEGALRPSPASSSSTRRIDLPPQ